MGSLLIEPRAASDERRRFGKAIVAGEFMDNDGVLVSLAVNIDQNGELFELDSWKVTFEPLNEWPNPAEIRIAPRNDRTSSIDVG